MTKGKNGLGKVRCEKLRSGQRKQNSGILGIMKATVDSKRGGRVGLAENLRRINKLRTKVTKWPPNNCRSKGRRVDWADKCKFDDKTDSQANRSIPV